MRSKVKCFYWDKGYEVPLLGIIAFARKNTDLKVFDIDNGTSTYYQIAFGRSKKDVQEYLRVPWDDEVTPAMKKGEMWAINVSLRKEKKSFKYGW